MVQEITIRFLLSDLIKIFIIFSPPGYTAAVIKKPSCHSNWNTSDPKATERARRRCCADLPQSRIMSGGREAYRYRILECRHWPTMFDRNIKTWRDLTHSTEMSFPKVASQAPGLENGWKLWNVSYLLLLFSCHSEKATWLFLPASPVNWLCRIVVDRCICHSYSFGELPELKFLSASSLPSSLPGLSVLLRKVPQTRKCCVKEWFLLITS